MQTRLASFVESWGNVAVGLGINLLANWAILPWFGFTPTLRQNLTIGALYTVVSVVRSYCIRRYFNGLRWGNR